MSSRIRPALLALVLASCDAPDRPSAAKDAPRADAPSGAPSSAPTGPASASAAAVSAPEPAGTPAVASAAAPGRRACWATEAFTTRGGQAKLALPASYAPLDACDALTSVFSDYDPTTESAASAGGAVRGHRAFEVTLGGRSLLVLSFYTGTAAEEGLLCGCCEAAAQVAVFERARGALPLVARTKTPIPHGGLGTGVSLFPTSLELDGSEGLLVLEAGTTCGNAPLRRVVHGFRVDGTALTPVLTWRVGARGVGASGLDVVEVNAAVRNEPRKDGPNDVVFAWSRAPCPFDDAAGSYVCKPGVPQGSERLRFDGKTYKLQGPRARLELLDF